MLYHVIVSTGKDETVGGVSLKAKEGELISSYSMKIWYTVTLKDYEHLVYFNLVLFFTPFYSSIYA